MVLQKKVPVKKESRPPARSKKTGEPKLSRRCSMKPVYQFTVSPVSFFQPSRMAF